MMKYIRENKAIFAMVLIVIVCLVVSITLLLKYFYFGNGGSNYGDRLEGIENVKIEDSKLNEISNKIKEDENVTDASVRIQGKIIYIRMIFTDGYNLIKAQNLAVKTLDEFSEEEKKFYDISFTLKSNATEKDEGFMIMGSHNVNGSNLVWNNNNPVTEEEEE